MAITRISQSSIKEGLEKYNSFVAGYPGVFGDFESIATITVGSGGANSITFSDIPGGFQHLQIRGIGRTDWSGQANDQFKFQFNGDTTAANYAVHFLIGNGSAASAEGYTSQGNMNAYSVLTGPTATASIFGAVVVDILDYASTSKNKVMRSLGGQDRNGAGNVAVASSVWLSTSAITSIKLIKIGTNFVQYSTFALYGVKAP